MHRELRELLHLAEGQSRRVVVVFLDVRGFSSFAGIEESTDTAEFLKTIYIKILDDFFPDAEFFKPTGDGLLILLDYSADTLVEVIRSAVDKSIELVECFSDLCTEEPMINFDVPTKLGIGLARGSATSLTADGKVLDYSGRPLNLASRLMDLARPAGIVFDHRFGYELLTEPVRARFANDSAYVKGLAEAEPVPVYRLDGLTEIPELAKRPLDGFVRFSEKTETLDFGKFRQRTLFRHRLSRKPARTDNIEAHLWHPKVLPDGSRGDTTILWTLPTSPLTVAGGFYALVDYENKVAEMSAAGVQDDWPVSIVIEYSVPPSDV